MQLGLRAKTLTYVLDNSVVVHGIDGGGGGGATTNNGFHCIKNQHNVCGAAEVEHSNPNMKVIHWDVLQVDLPKDGLNVSCIMVTMTMTRTMMKKTERGCKTPPLYKHAFNIAFLIVLMCFNLIILVVIHDSLSPYTSITISQLC